MLCGFVLPGKVDGFEGQNIPGHLDRLPVWVFQKVETEVARISADSPARTQFPTPPESQPPGREAVEASLPISMRVKSTRAG
jgi:hypothetical protein